MNHGLMEHADKSKIDDQEQKLVAKGYRKVTPRKHLQPGEYFREESSDVINISYAYRIEWEIK
jgi:hypothetical protein